MLLGVLSFRSPASKSRSGLAVLMEPDGTGIWRELFSEFNERFPENPVRLVEGPPATNAREDLYATSFLSGESAFDIVYCDVIWVAKFAAAGWLRPWPPHLLPEEKEDFLPTDLEAGMYDGRLYRIPAFTDAGLLYYRKDLVPNPPETFDELVLHSRRLQTGERWGFLWQGKQYEGLTTVFLEILWGFGGRWIDPETGETFLDMPPALAALRFLKNSIGTITPAGVTGYSEEDTRLLFQSGRAVFLRNWPYVWKLIQRSNAPVADKVAFTTMVHSPGGSGAATLGGWGFAVSSFCSNPEGARMFVNFITSHESLRRVEERLGLLPARRSLLPEAFRPIVESVRPRPPIAKYAQASDILQRWVSSALTGRIPCEKALKEADRETRLLLGKVREDDP
jgi:multiple sugar transport system substrate-binding protein